MGLEFEWDEGKAASNLEKHGVAFEDATKVFSDRLGVERPDLDGVYDEERWQMIGLVDGRLLTVIFTERKGKVRLISARKAIANERREYWEHRELYL